MCRSSKQVELSEVMPSRDAPCSACHQALGFAAQPARCSDPTRDDGDPALIYRRAKGRAGGPYPIDVALPMARIRCRPASRSTTRPATMMGCSAMGSIHQESNEHRKVYGLVRGAMPITDFD